MQQEEQKRTTAEEEKAMEKKKKQIVMWLIPILLFLVFLFYVMIRSFNGEIKDAITDTRISSTGFASLSDSLEGTLEESIYGRYDYINLNGLVTRVLGINTLNDRYKLANGYLARRESAKDTTEYAEQVILFHDFLAERGIDFLYLQAPSKESFWDVEFLPGYSSDSWKTLDSMVSSLTAAGVATLDMNAWFEENGWHMEDVFFKTDHHWLPRAALAAAGATMEMLEESGIAKYEEELLCEESYTVTTLENWFLGSHGKRVGTLYAGTDDFDVYVPNFATEYTYAEIKKDTTTWFYSDSLLRWSYTEQRDYYGQDTHGVYLYGERPLQIITNAVAENDERVLIIGDSFRREWSYFLATQFREVYLLDLGTTKYSDGTVAEYVEEVQPDLVLMCMNPSRMKKEAYALGVEEYETALEATTKEEAEVAILSEVVIDAQEDNETNFTVVGDNLEPNQTYTLTVDTTSYNGGEDRFVQMTLQDLSTNTAIYNRYFDANSKETQKWIFTTPEDVNGSYAIYLYAGTRKHTAGCTVKMKGITLRKGIFED